MGEGAGVSFSLEQNGRDYHGCLQSTVPYCVSARGAVDTGQVQQVVFTSSKINNNQARGNIYVDDSQLASRVLDFAFYNYPLAIANRVEELLPWLGEVHLLALYSRALSPLEIDQNYLALKNLWGDFDKSGCLDAADIDLLTGKVRDDPTNAVFDLDKNGRVDQEDRRIWVEDKDYKYTYFGDANLDGQFNSGDLVVVFRPGQYEDAVEGNSGWASGDWNGDFEFTSSDLVLAFQRGGYEMGTRPRRAPVGVPEPSGTLFLCCATLIVSVRRSRPHPATAA